MIPILLVALATMAASPSSVSEEPNLARCEMSKFWSDTYRPKPAFPNQTRAPAPAKPSKYQMKVFATGLVHPWALVFLPDGRMLVTERPGRMRIIDKAGKLSEPIKGLPPIKIIGGEGLHDVLLDRDFATNRTLYFTYFAPLADGVLSGAYDPTWVNWLALPAGQHEPHAQGYARLASAKLSVDGTQLEDMKVILEGADRRIVQTADGKLLVEGAAPAGGLGDVDDEPLRMNNTYGKVLRINTDGSIPTDNPWYGKPDVRPEIFAAGQRDQLGAAINPNTGDLWTNMNGPRGGDALAIVKAGDNFGFPSISYGRNYSGKLIGGSALAKGGYKQPVYFWTPSIAPSGLMFYTGDLFPEWRNSVFVGGLSAKRLVRLELDGDKVVAEEPMLVDQCRRIRDVRQGPEGALYVLTEEVEGEVLRLTP